MTHGKCSNRVESEARARRLCPVLIQFARRALFVSTKLLCGSALGGVSRAAVNGSQTGKTGWIGRGERCMNCDDVHGGRIWIFIGKKSILPNQLAILANNRRMPNGNDSPVPLAEMKSPPGANLSRNRRMSSPKSCFFGPTGEIPSAVHIVDQK
jgi:hypothetical protein